MFEFELFFEVGFSGNSKTAAGSLILQTKHFQGAL